MNIPEHILKFLKKYGKAGIPEFGVFSLRNTGAIMHSETKTILPPAKQIFFEADYELQNEDFLNFINAVENQKENTKTALKAQTDYWKKMLLNKDDFFIEGLGNFYVSDNELIFKGERIQTDAPDFYGLEEINISEITNSESAPRTNNSDKRKSYRFSNSAIWLFLMIISVCVLAYLAFTNKELLFGKKSFESNPVQNSTQKNQQKQNTEDSIRLKQQERNIVFSDSLQKDSVIKVNEAYSKPSNQ